jgi:hypothetical protein
MEKHIIEHVRNMSTAKNIRKKKKEIRKFVFFHICVFFDF